MLSIISTSLLCGLSFIILPAIAQDPSPGGPTQPNTVKNCNAWHTVKDGDVCTKLEDLYHITRAQFVQWNPDVSQDCTQNFWGGYAYCVGVGPIPTSGTSSSTRSTTVSRTTTSRSVTTESSGKTSSTLTTTSINETYSIREPMHSWNITKTPLDTAFPPQKTQPGQPANCIDWRPVYVGDTCEHIVAVTGYMSMAEFLAANPDIGQDCSSLWIDWWVCIRTKSTTTTYSFEYNTGSNTGSVSIPDPTSYTPPSLPTANSSFVAQPTRAVVSDCVEFFKAAPDNTCKDVPHVAAGLVSEQQFLSWNPPLKQCNDLWAGYYYCAFAGSSGSMPSVTAKPTSTPVGQARNCNKWYQAQGEETCDLLVMAFGTFSRNDLVSWNPSLGSNCNLQEDMLYCIGIPGSPTTRTDGGPPSTTIPTSEPTQSGMTPSCTTLWLVQQGDSCTSISRVKGIKVANLLSWNPALGADCKGLKTDVYVCVGV